MAASAGSGSSQAVSSSLKPGEVSVQREAGVEYKVPDGVSVLMYHMIGSDKNNSAVMTAENLRRQLNYLKNNGYHPITLDELYAYVTQGAPLPDKPVCLTFDDGYADSYTIVYPMMKEFHYPWTLFIITGQVGQQNRVTWDQLREMAASHTMTIASHTYSHPKLHEISYAQKKEEIQKAQADIKRELGWDNVWFCYPYGSYDQETEDILKSAGIKMAVTSDGGRVRTGNRPYELKRIWIGNEVTNDRLKERLTKDNYSIIP